MKSRLIIYIILFISNSALTQSAEMTIIERYIHPCVLDAMFENSIELLRSGCASTNEVNISLMWQVKNEKTYEILSNSSNIILRESYGNLYSFFIVLKEEKDFTEFTNAWIKEFSMKTDGELFYMHSSWPMFTINLNTSFKDAPPNTVEIWLRFP